MTLYIIVGIAFLLAFLAIQASYQAKEEATDVIYTAVSQDFEKTKRDIMFNQREADWYIDQFEQRWVNYLTHKELQYYIGRLIEAHIMYAGYL